MSLIQKKGNEVAESVNKKDIDFKTVFIRLKDGEAIKVRFLGVSDYVEYKAHSNGFAYKIYTQPCSEPLGQDCPLCKAYKYGLSHLEKGQPAKESEYYDLRPSKRYLVAMVDLEMDCIRVWDCSKTQLKNFISQLEEYKEMIEEGEECYFTFKRTGTATSTTYTLSPIMPTGKKNLAIIDKIKPVYEKWEDEVVNDDFYEDVLHVRKPELLIETLKTAGLPIEEIFPEYEATFVNEDADADTDEGEPIDDGEMPF